MPGYVLYVMCFLPWAALATLVWIAALVMYCIGQPLARPLALAMAATFPTVFLFQMIAGAIDAVILLLVLWVQSRHTSMGDTVLSWMLLQTIIAMLVMSAIGFYEGWNIGWAWGKGLRLRDVILERPSVRLARRLYPLPFSVSQTVGSGTKAARIETAAFHHPALLSNNAGY